MASRLSRAKARVADTPMDLRVGADVELKGQRGRITNIVGLSEVLVRESPSGRVVRAAVSTLKPYVAKRAVTGKTRDLEGIDDEEWREAERKLAIIRPLLEDRARTRNKVELRAKECGLHVNTLYEWIADYNNTGRLSSLLRQARADKGSTKLDPRVEAIVQAAVDSVYLTDRKLPIRSVMKELRRRVTKAKVPLPHVNTVRNRIAMRSEESKTAAREGKKKAREKFAPIKGSFPGADYPMAVVQIDHMKANIMLVDSEFRKAIARPWVTVAIDVYSRVIVGLHVSFDPPSALAVGLCLGNAMLGKEKWLARLRVKGEWPVWGPMHMVHADNAREFKGNMIRRACQEYLIDLRWRPVRTPHYGAHIERLCGTLKTEIQTLPGRTARAKDRNEYDPEKNAAMTLEEFEAWLVDFIVNVYHRRPHQGLGVKVCPVLRWEEGVVGTKTQPGTGLPPRYPDEEKVRLDWLPFFERTIQDYGVLYDGIHYYHDVLRSWIGARDVEHKQLARKFIFRYDKRSTATVWFYDPELQLYFPIPYRDPSRPDMTHWELREARKAAGVKGKSHDDEPAIFAAYERLRRREEASVAKTKAARRSKARREGGQKQVVRRTPAPLKPQPIPQGIKPFEHD